ncbi:ribosome biogenesis protein NSA2 homolog isoform X3 [Phoenix dactylifera]|uniref:Ribosome biogenesis protein NSA2 homolog isoform X3 n=1 Tax=Phoenix dactylifera TaxID=42345 RepID=A0A8B9ALW8_PHODC|nr:ribosome biogenesis protein NSA2 homolog isoform X3 [Phoenix dactylifera]
MRELFLHIFWIVTLRHAQRFLATLLSKRGRKRLASGRSHFQRSGLWLKMRCLKLLVLASTKLKICLTIMRRFRYSAKQWKRMVTKVTCRTRVYKKTTKKYERFIRPMGLKFTKANVTHPELKCTFNPGIIGIKKNPNGPMYTSLGAVTKGTISET